jgi:hypothetical protein
MKTLLMSFIGLCIATTVAAQEPPRDLNFAFTAPCDELLPMAQVIKKYGERPLVSGKGTVRHITGQVLAGTVTLWLEPSGKSFSLSFDNGQMACMLATGKEMYPTQ